MTTPLLDTTFAVGGLTFNASDSNGVEWWGDAISGWHEPVPRRSSASSKVAGHGDYRARGYLDSRLITLEGAIIAPSRALFDSARDKLAALGIDGALMQWTATEPSGAYVCNVEVVSGPRVKPLNEFSGTLQLQLSAPDPFKYSAVEHSVSMPLAQSAPGGILWAGTPGNTGIQWNGVPGVAVTGLVYQSGDGETGTRKPVNAGTVEAWPRFSIAGPVTDPSVVDLGSGETVTWSGTVATGQMLTIDTRTQAVLLDGSDRSGTVTRFDQISIPAGSSAELAFRAPAPAPGATLTVAWRDTWS